MGEVREARGPRLNRPVAIKFSRKLNRGTPAVEAVGSTGLSCLREPGPANAQNLRRARLIAAVGADPGLTRIPPLPD